MAIPDSRLTDVEVKSSLMTRNEESGNGCKLRRNHDMPSPHVPKKLPAQGLANEDQDAGTGSAVT
jgi:hypothetical protein